MMNMDVIDQKTVNPFVPGSSPGQGAKLNNQDIFGCLFLWCEGGWLITNLGNLNLNQVTFFPNT